MTTGTAIVTYLVYGAFAAYVVGLFIRLITAPKFDKKMVARERRKNRGA